MDYTPLTAALGAMAIAIGVEFTILLMSRYYEERGKGKVTTEAMTMALTRIGRAIAASALTTIGGFAALLFAFDFLILQDFGIITMINVFFALAVTILVLPSLVVIVDRWRERRKKAHIE
jgi:predicted RND superfamily exporter protein